MQLSIFVFWASTVAAAIAYLMKRYRKLRNVPGPLITSFTDIWRSYNQIFNGPFSDVLISLHEKYGPVVRIGPNTVSIADSSTVDTIYTLRGEFTKADSYAPLRSLAKDKVQGSIIDMQDEKKNSQLKRALGGAFAQHHVLEYEQDVDKTIAALIKRLSKTPTVSLFEVLQQYQADFLMKVAFGEDTAFLEKDEDATKFSFQNRFQHWVRWQGFPVLEHWIYKTPFLRIFFGSSQPPLWAQMALEKLQRRKARGLTQISQDLLSKYIIAGEKHDDMMDADNLIRVISSTISAGFDTTAFTMTAMLYFLTQSPQAYGALLQELEEATNRGDLGPSLKYEETYKLPYLDAVMREAMRCFPFLTLPLERCVPPAGIMVCGLWLPGGTYVGCHPTVIHHDRTCFGSDPDRFRPERWLDGDAITRATMERASLGFGSGKRICLGRHLAELEIKKAIPALLLKFKIKLLHDDLKLESSDGLTPFPKPVLVDFKARC